jgi:hypothetical protein
MQEFQEFPKVIYKGGDVLKEAIVVLDAGQEALSLEAGFEPATAQYDAHDKANEKELLIAQAEEKGIQVDARWGIKRLQDEIAKAE